MKRNYLFTSESVTEGHPDKMCDQISDAILDAVLQQDPYGRVACETLVKTGWAVLAGEITTTAHIEYTDIVRDVVKEIGYEDATSGFDYRSCGVLVAVERQSPDIAQGVDQKEDGQMGAGDQGMMFGFACDDTDAYMPMPIQLAHQLSRRLAKVRKDGILPFLRPDGKTQVTVRYDGFTPVKVDTIVVSSQHTHDSTLQQVEEGVREEVIRRVIPEHLLASDTRILVNPTGRFVVGGPLADSGLTGRKIIVDTYGGMGRHGGGAFSGKDPSKVDRSASYMTRYIAKNMVAAGLASRLEVQVAYAIGVAEPVSVHVDSFGTGKIPEEKMVDIIRKVFDLRPLGIILSLNLLVPRYRGTAAYGHFGRSEPGFTWEALDKVAEIKAEAGI